MHLKGTLHVIHKVLENFVGIVRDIDRIRFLRTLAVFLKMSE